MDFEEFDDVKSEKAKALCRYLKAQKLGTLIRVAEALCALFVLVYYFADVSQAVEVAGGFLRRLLKVLTTPFSAFVFGNSIILVIFVLSGGGKDRDERGDGNGDGVFRRVYEEYESHLKSSPPVAEDSPEATGTEKPIVFSSSPEEVKEITTVTVVYVDVNEIPTVAKVTATDVDSQPWEDKIGSQIGGHGEGKAVDKGVPGRSNSEGIAAKITDNSRNVTEPIKVDSPSPWPLLVEDLSNEEFNLKVESYIARKKLVFREEMQSERRSATHPEIVISENNYYITPRD